MIRAALLGLAVCLAGPIPEALAGGFHAGRGPAFAHPGVGRALHHAPGHVYGRPFRGYGYGYGYGYGLVSPYHPLDLYPAYGHGHAAYPSSGGSGGASTLTIIPGVPEVVGIAPQPVGVPTLTVISTDRRTRRVRATVHQVGADSFTDAGSPGPRIVRARVPRGR